MQIVARSFFSIVPSDKFSKFQFIDMEDKTQKSKSRLRSHRVQGHDVECSFPFVLSVLLQSFLCKNTQCMEDRWVGHGETIG